MIRYVVDASVAVKWYLPEVHSECADRLLAAGCDLIAPDLIVAEVGDILWKRVMQAEITDQKALAILRALVASPVTLKASKRISEAAFTVACGLKRTYYDSLYLALAAVADCRMVTADRKLYDAVRSAAAARKHILWIEDIPDQPQASA